MAEWKEEYDYYFDRLQTANKNSAKQQMDFQERMSNTAHQREVKDLIASGLNPVLSANNGASSPQGAYASVDSSPISAKFQAKNLQKELENARLITQMQNDNAYNIAMRQLAENMKYNYYATDQQTKTARFNTIVQEYGIGAALAYGLMEDIYKDLDPSGALGSDVKNWIGDKNQVDFLLGKIDNSAKNFQESEKRTDSLLDSVAKELGYNNNANYHIDKALKKVSANVNPYSYENRYNLSKANVRKTIKREAKRIKILNKMNGKNK